MFIRSTLVHSKSILSVSIFVSPLKGPFGVPSTFHVILKFSLLYLVASYSNQILSMIISFWFHVFQTFHISFSGIGALASGSPYKSTIFCYRQFRSKSIPSNHSLICVAEVYPFFCFSVYFTPLRQNICSIVGEKLFNIRINIDCDAVLSVCKQFYWPWKFKQKRRKNSFPKNTPSKRLHVSSPFAF